MSVLVTGGAGYIGAHMVLELQARGERIVVVDNLSTGIRSALAPNVLFVLGDAGDAALIQRVIADHEVDAIIHFAGSIVVPESVSDPLGYYHNNTCKSRTLIETAIRQGVGHFIFSSTAAVYGMPEHSPINEAAPTLPISPYGSSKLMTEWMLRDAAAAHPLSYVALRYFNVAGADPHGRCGQSTPNATHLIKVACQAALGQRPRMSVFGSDYDTADGTGVRDYIHVGDLIRAHGLALDYLRDGGRSRVLNCGYGRGFSVLQVIDAVRKVSGVDFPVEAVERRSGDPGELVARAERIRDDLGWMPRYDDLDLIVRHALEWERQLATAQAVID